MCFVGGGYWLGGFLFVFLCKVFVVVEKYQYFERSSWKYQIKDVHTIHCTIQFLTD